MDEVTAIMDLFGVKSEEELFAKLNEVARKANEDQRKIMEEAGMEIWTK